MLFSKGKKNANASADIVEAKDSLPEIPFTVRETVEYIDEDDAHISLCISDVWSDKENGLCVSLQRTPGMFTLPYMKPGEKATFYAFPGGSHPVFCSGIILSASRIKADVGNITYESMENKRGEYRLSLSGPVILFKQEDQERKNKLEASMVNVSSGGMAFCAKTEFAEGDIYGAMFRLTPGGPWRTYYGQIIWVKPLPSGRNMYGMIFSLLTQQEKDDLVSDIFKAQRNLRG